MLLYSANSPAYIQAGNDFENNYQQQFVHADGSHGLQADNHDGCGRKDGTKVIRPPKQHGSKRLSKRHTRRYRNDKFGNSKQKKAYQTNEGQISRDKYHEKSEWTG